ncbi:MAG: hypothetical protein M3Q45_07345, partial [Chloroflexota bacterium]|nr:hypothetical protein [Chloroflexota bacterium]
PYTVHIDYSTFADATALSVPVMLQTWNAATESWETRQSTTDTAQQTITAHLDRPAILGVFQAEEPTMAAQQASIYLPVISR